MINAHFYNSTMLNESRIMKETESLASQNLFKKIFIVGLFEEGLLEKEPIDATREIIRINLKDSFLNKIYLLKIFLSFHFMYKSFQFFKGQKVDVVQVHNLATLPLGILFKLTKKSKLVYDAHELETERTGWPSYIRFMAKIAERTLIRFVDTLLVVGPSIAEHYAKAYNNKPQPQLIINAPKFIRPKKTNYLKETLNIPSTTPLFIYVGLISEGRGILEMIETFKVTKKDIALVFLGFGPGVDTVKEAAKQSNKLFFHEAVPIEKLIDVTASADYGLTFLLTPDHCLSYYYAMPNKFFEYAFSELPFISTYGKDMAYLVKEYGLGEVYDPSESTLETVIDKILARNYAEMVENTKRFRADYCWEKQEEKYLKIYREIIITIPA